MLTWKRTSEDSRNLQIINPEKFKKEGFERLVETFYNASSVAPNERLMKELVEIHENPGCAVFSCSGDLRSGYVGLNRWCITDSPRDQHGVLPARALWRFIFQKGGVVPPKLAGPPGNGPLELIEREWDTWYLKIS
ncbi:MAG: hypothetical protein HOH77_02925 [Candidatus Latescibacteria bacterium]|jgi:hypothetical protein|nr:hypothetical protein [Candidatus Latescibacterota bacterium]